MEKDFNKKIKEILENPPDLPFDEKAWDKMNKRLEGDNPNTNGRGGVLPWWAIAALWLLSLGVTAFALNHKIQKSNNTITELKNELQSKIQTDTVVEYRTVVVYDTFYKGNTTRNNTLAARSSIFTLSQATLWNLKSQAPNSPDYFEYENFDIASAYQPSLSQLQQLTGQTFVKRQAEEHRLAKAEQIRTLSPLSSIALSSIDYQSYFDPTEMITIPALVKRKRNINPLLYLQPTGLSIGGYIGSGEHLNIRDDDGGIFMPSLMASINFGKRFRMEIGVEYLRHNYKIEEDGEFSKFPIVAPQDPQDLLNEIKIEMEYLQIPVGFKYALRPKKKLQPLIGVGLIARRTISQYLDYKFEKSLLESYEILWQSDESDFELSSVWGSLGLEYYWSDKWSLLMEGVFQQDIHETDYSFQDQRLLSLRGGVKFHF